MSNVNWDMAAVLVAIAAVLAASFLNLWAVREQISTSHQSHYRSDWNKRLIDLIAGLLEAAKYSDLVGDDDRLAAAKTSYRTLVELKMMLDPPYPEQRELLRLVQQELDEIDLNRISSNEQDFMNAARKTLEKNWKRLKKGK